jgi:nitrate reductase assembly molybdenum cofactor insertion protein NarJ
MHTKKNELLQQAAEWRLISLFFECPNEYWKKEVNALAQEVMDEDLKIAAQAAEIEGNEGLYHSILGPGGPAPSREISYNSWAEPGYLMSELTAYYQAFAYQPETKEAIDHISVEAGFIGYLYFKQAYAVVCGKDEEAKITDEAIEHFIKNHLNSMAEPLATILEDLDVEYLIRASKALLKRVGKAKHSALPVFDTAFKQEDCQFDCGEI